MKELYFNANSADMNKLSLSQSVLTVSSSEGYAFVPTDPFRDADKEQTKELNKGDSYKQQKMDKRHKHKFETSK